VLDRRIAGLEALARASDPTTKQPISPLTLFEAAQAQGLTLRLDRLCRERAVEDFVSAALPDEGEPLLFLNLDVSILKEGIVGSGHLIRLLERHGLPARRVAIELIESKISDLRATHRFLDTHREHGFLIALDDVGAGNSNFDRILDLRPDILKLDRSLVSAIDRDYRKQEAFSCCTRIAQKLGIVVIAEGVETEAEALGCLERGAELMQGYYFARPCAPTPDWPINDGLARVKGLEAILKQRKLEQFLARKGLYRSYNAAAGDICEAVAATAEDGWGNAITAQLARHPFVECAYVLNEAGVQITDTIFAPGRRGRRPCPLFAPGKVGSRQGTKEYFLCLGPQQQRYVTDPYVSRATGTLCVTFSSYVRLPTSRLVVVCVDIDAGEGGR